MRIGARVTLAAGSRERAITLLGPWESKPEKDVISYESDLGQQLVGKRRGDRIDYSGENWEIQNIAPHR